MSTPVISRIQSVLGYLEGEDFVFQPYATNAPTGWTSSTLPPGVALNAGTGALTGTGAATVPGVYVVALRASNALGTSAPQVFTIGIEISAAAAAAAAAAEAIAAGGVDPNSSAVGLCIDLVTHRVSMSPAFDPAADAAAVLAIKFGDSALFPVRFFKAGIQADLPLTAFKFSLKEFETEEVLVTSTAWVKTGSGVASQYKMLVKFTGDALAGALDAYADDSDTMFPARIEFEWVETLSPAIGGIAELRTSSRTARMDIFRDLTPN